MAHLTRPVLGLAYLQYRFLHDRSLRLQGLAEVIRLHRDQHAQDWLMGACEEAIATGELEAVLNRFRAPRHASLMRNGWQDLVGQP
jgi:hypothetical protein